MNQLTIRLPQELMERLRLDAIVNHRSLSNQALYLIEQQMVVTPPINCISEVKPVPEPKKDPKVIKAALEAEIAKIVDRPKESPKPEPPKQEVKQKECIIGRDQHKFDKRGWPFCEIPGCRYFRVQTDSTLKL